MVDPRRDAEKLWSGGLQPERTALAWVRTGLALVVVSLLVGRLVGSSGPTALVVTGLGLVAAWSVVAAQEGRHRRRTRQLHRSEQAQRPGELPVPGLRPAVAAALLLLVATVSLAVASAVLVLASG